MGWGGGWARGIKQIMISRAWPCQGPERKEEGEEQEEAGEQEDDKNETDEGEEEDEEEEDGEEDKVIQRCLR